MADVVTAVTTVVVAAALVVSVAILLVRRHQSRKQLSWEALLDAKIGLVPEPPEGHENPDLGALQCLEQLRNVSVLTVRIRNSGRTPIVATDFPHPDGLRLEFEQRYILDFRVSDPTKSTLRDQIVAGSSASEIVGDTGGMPMFQTGRPQLRAQLSDALGGLLTEQQMQNRRQFNLPAIDLPPGSEFTLIVDLHELRPQEDNVNLTKGFEFAAGLRSGRLIDASARVNRILNRAALGLSLVAAGALAVLIPLQWPGPPDPPRYCAHGAAKLVGSTAFRPATEEIAKAYVQDCTGTSIAVGASGSLEGIRELQKPGVARDLGSLSDGPAAERDGLSPHPVAIIIFSMVVNGDVGIKELTVQQVRAIYQGQYTNWRQLGAKVDLPIRLVSRNADSGTRKIFENNVLGGREPAVTSDSCKQADQGPGTLMIRCERASTDEVLSAVGQIPGALVYADNTDVSKFPNVVRLRLDGRDATVDHLTQGYPFWSVEYLNTRGVPPDDSVLKGLIGYLSTDTARAKVREAGYTPCLAPSGAVTPLCEGDH